MTQNLSAEASQALSSLEKKWPKLHNDVARGEAIKTIHDMGVAYRILGERLGRSESGIRHLCVAAKAPLRDRLRSSNENLAPAVRERRAVAVAELVRQPGDLASERSVLRVGGNGSMRRDDLAAITKNHLFATFSRTQQPEPVERGLAVIDGPAGKGPHSRRHPM